MFDTTLKFGLCTRRHWQALGIGDDKNTDSIPPVSLSTSHFSFLLKPPTQYAHVSISRNSLSRSGRQKQEFSSGSAWHWGPGLTLPAWLRGFQHSTGTEGLMISRLSLGHRPQDALSSNQGLLHHGRCEWLSAINSL